MNLLDTISRLAVHLESPLSQALLHVKVDEDSKLIKAATSIPFNLPPQIAVQTVAHLKIDAQSFRAIQIRLVQHNSFKVCLGVHQDLTRCHRTAPPD